MASKRKSQQLGCVNEEDFIFYWFINGFLKVKFLHYGINSYIILKEKSSVITWNQKQMEKQSKLYDFLWKCIPHPFISCYNGNLKKNSLRHAENFAQVRESWNRVVLSYHL